MIDHTADQTESQVDEKEKEVIDTITDELVKILISNPSYHLDDYREIFSETFLVSPPVFDNDDELLVKYINKTEKLKKASKKSKAKKNRKEKVEKDVSPQKIPKLIVKLKPLDAELIGLKDRKKETDKSNQTGHKDELRSKSKSAHISHSSKTKKYRQVPDEVNLCPPSPPSPTSPLSSSCKTSTAESKSKPSTSNNDRINKTSSKETFSKSSKSSTITSNIKDKSIDHQSKKLPLESPKVSKLEKPRQFDPVRDRFKSTLNKNYKISKDVLGQLIQTKDQSNDGNNSTAKLPAHSISSNKPSTSKQFDFSKDQEKNVQKILDKFKIPKKPKNDSKQIDNSSNLPQISSLDEEENQPIVDDNEEDIDPLDIDDIDLGFDLYDQPLTELENQSTPQVSSQELKEFDDMEVDQVEITDIKTESPILSINKNLKVLLDESEDSDEEINFKRRGSRKKSDSEESDEESGQSSTKISSQDKTTSIVIPKSALENKFKYYTGADDMDQEPDIAHLTYRKPSSGLSHVSADEIIREISNSENSSEAMKIFIQKFKEHRQIFIESLPRFQSLYKEILARLVRETKFFFQPHHYNFIISKMQELEMDNSDHWEDVICLWGQCFPSISHNTSKKVNTRDLMKKIYDYLEEQRIMINLNAARLLLEISGLLS